MPEPVRIVGAGPSGLSAAITLAKAGRPALVLEKRADVGARFIGDWQVLENLSSDEDALELVERLGIERSFEIVPGREAVFLDHRLRARTIRSERPYGYFLRRGAEEGTLDRSLLAQARAAGVDVRFGVTADRAGADVVATGPAAPDGLAREATFRTDLPDGTVWVLFDHRYAPGGYAYLFALSGRATLGCAIVHDFKRIDEYFERSAERFRQVKAYSVEGERVGYSYMSFSLKSSAVEGGARFAGEAGGFQDYLFGLGMRHALVSGHLAARAILESRAYDELWREAFGRVPQTSLVNRFLYESAGNLGLADFVRRAAKASSLQDYLAGWYRDAAWKRMLLPIVTRLWKSERCTHRHPHDWCRKSPVARMGRHPSPPELGESKRAEKGAS